MCAPPAPLPCAGAVWPPVGLSGQLQPPLAAANRGFPWASPTRALATCNGGCSPAWEHRHLPWGFLLTLLSLPLFPPAKPRPAGSGQGSASSRARGGACREGPRGCRPRPGALLYSPAAGSSSSSSSGGSGAMGSDGRGCGTRQRRCARQRSV